jgi:N-methylhydantoinase B
MTKMDPIALEILWTRTTSVVDEAAANFVRASFSTLVREANDFAVVLTDAKGRNIAQSTQSIPSFICTLPASIRHFIEEFGVEDMQPGDAFITNDPWLGSGHLNDATLAMPIFHNDELVAFAGVVSHLPDVGGRLRNPQNMEIYEEGLQIPPTRILSAGAPDETLFNIIRANVRVPDETVGDIWAQVTCCRSLSDRLCGLLDETGVHIYDFAEEVISRTETAMRNAISEIPDGRYCYEITNDGPKQMPEGIVRIKCAVIIEGDEVTVDYTGSTEQVNLAINTVWNYTFAYTAYALKAIFAPWIPNAEGSFRPVHIKVPEGLILNPQRPAPCGARGMVGHLLPPAIFGALADVMPDRVQAPSGSPSNSFQLASIQAEQPYSVNSFVGSGQGASQSQDGVSAISFPSNLANTPTEILEAQAPIEIRQRTIRRGSGGNGKHPGGDGMTLEFAHRGETPAIGSFILNRLRCPAPGLFGGESGTAAHLVIAGQEIDASGQYVLNPGDSVLFETAGGGGFGEPEKK